MGWKMTKEAALKRQKAERLFEEGFGPLKVSRELEVNFYIVRDWKTAWKNKVEKRNQGNTPLNRTIASSLFSFGYGYRTVGKMLQPFQHLAQSGLGQTASQAFNRASKEN